MIVMLCIETKNIIIIIIICMEIRNKIIFIVILSMEIKNKIIIFILFTKTYNKILSHVCACITLEWLLFYHTCTCGMVVLI